MREDCLNILIWVLVLILWEKTGNFLSFFDIQISTFYKIKFRTFLRYSSLHPDFMNVC